MEVLIMLRSNIQLSEFVAQLKILLMSVVVKRDKLATAFDTTLEQKKAADKYINAIDNGDNWESYVQFDHDVLLEAGLDKNMIVQYQRDKETIPRVMRDKVVKLQKQYNIDSYVETNDYYLMLNGQPPIEDVEQYNLWVEEQKKDRPNPKITNPYVYCPENEYTIPTDIALHQMPNDWISLMESTGVLDQVIAANPTKHYLKYLGSKRISIYNARTANNFALLYADFKNVDTSIYQDFVVAYDKARAYYMIGYYNREYSNMFTWYDEFMGLLIIIMATQRLISNIYKQGLSRDFYDTNLIKYLFKSYSIPYIEDMDLKYQKALAKNLNYLLQYKSTDKVLYDISYLLGFYDINIYKYYLVKDHRIDPETDKPIFKYKTRKENGQVIKEPDYRQMFDFHFQQVNLKEDDVNSALTDQKNRQRYEEIVAQDPYWLNDDELKEKLYETDFNFMVTKYMSLDVIVKIVEMMYEVAHTVRSVIDNSQDFKKITINIPYISQYDMSIYDAVILMCALGAKKLNLKGNVPLKGYQIANVYGFNYTQDIDALKNAIYDTKDLRVGDILFAEDTLGYYRVLPGEKIRMKNHFRNQYSSDNTSEYTYVEKYGFEPLNVTRISSIPDNPTPGLYAYVSEEVPMYKYVGTEYIELDTYRIWSYLNTKNVTSLPDVGEPGVFYRMEIDRLTHVYVYEDTGWREINPNKIYDEIPFIDVAKLPKHGKDGKFYRLYPVYAPLVEYRNYAWNTLEVTNVPSLAYNLIDNGLATYITNMRVGNEDDVRELYKKVKTLRLFITKMIEETNDRDVYEQYCRLYRALMVTEDVQELYRDENGDVCNTYSDLLEKINPSLYSEYIKLINSDNDLNSAINSVFAKLSSFGDYKFLANINRADTMFDTVMKLVRFFKSYTVDFVNSGIHYIFDDRYFQGLKLIDELIAANAVYDIRRPLFATERWYKDLIQHYRANNSITDYLPIIDKKYLYSFLRAWDIYKSHLRDTFKFTRTNLRGTEYIRLFDDIGHELKDLHAKNGLILSDKKWNDIIMANPYESIYNKDSLNYGAIIDLSQASHVNTLISKDRVILSTAFSGYDNLNTKDRFNVFSYMD